MTKPAPISEAERRQTAELKLLEKRAREEARSQRAEKEARQRAKDVYSYIQAQFSEDLKKGKAYANRRYLQNLTEWAGDLVPVLMTPKEHTQIVMELTENLSSEDATHGDTPLELVARWMRGDLDLSRIPLEKERVN